MHIGLAVMLWPYALALIVLPFVLIDIHRRRHEPKGQDARRALLDRWAKERETARDDDWRDAERNARDAGNLASTGRE